MRIINSIFKAGSLTAALMLSAWTMAAAEPSADVPLMKHDAMHHDMRSMPSEPAMQKQQPDEKQVQKQQADLNADAAGHKPAQNCAKHSAQMSAEMHARMQKNDQAHACAMPQMNGGPHEHH